MISEKHNNLPILVDVFKAMGDPVRLKIIRILASKMENRLCVNDLVKYFGISQPAISQHLKILRNVGILNGTKDGYKVYYTINNKILYERKGMIDKLFEIAFEKCKDYPNCEHMK